MSEGNKQSLVIMTNGDVYYVGRGDLKALNSVLQDKRFEAFRFTDLKSRAKVTVHLRNVSSVVDQEADDAN
jgi:hypothetical protein